MSAGIAATPIDGVASSAPTFDGDWLTVSETPRNEDTNASVRRHARIVAGSNCRVGSRNTRLTPITSSRVTSIFARVIIQLTFYRRLTRYASIRVGFRNVPQRIT